MILPSGAELKITPAPFAIAKALLDSVLEEAKAIHVTSGTEIDFGLFKDMFCAGMSSKKVDACLKECMKRATYNGLKISDETFEPVEARGDYISVCLEVAKENLLPFTKSLYAQYVPALERLTKSRA